MERRLIITVSNSDYVLGEPGPWYMKSSICSLCAEGASRRKKKHDQRASREVSRRKWS